jgi:hypothetical protein
MDAEQLSDVAAGNDERQSGVLSDAWGEHLGGAHPRHGTQAWTLTRNGDIINGALNPTPETLQPANRPVASAAAPQPMSDQLSTRDAYEAMFRFLEAYYDTTGSDELGALLGGLALDEDGQPMDPAAWTDWLAAVRNVTDGGDASP